MNYKALIKKQSTIIAIAVICLTIATIGVSYALFFQVETNSENQVVTAGTLNVEYGSASSAISATELVPMSDDEALSSETMTGTIYIENTGTLPANYEVKLGNDTESFNNRSNPLDTDELLSHEYIKVAVYLDGNMIVEPTTLADIEYATDDTTMHSLFKSDLNTTGTGDSTATIVLKIWISDSAPEDIIGQYVYLKMDVSSVVFEDGVLTANGSSPLTLAHSNESTLVNYKIYGNSVQSSEPNPNAPIEIESVGEKSKNLLNTNTVEDTNRYISSSAGSTLEPSETGGTWRVSDYIAVTGGTTYHFNANNSNASVAGLAWYDINKTYISGENTKTTNANNGNITAPDTAYYLRVSWRIDETYNSDWQNTLQLEEGTAETEYEQYGYKIPVIISNDENTVTTNIYLDEPLRKVGDCEDLTECADYIDFSTGTVVRNIGYSTFDGTEDWSLPTVVLSEYSSYRLLGFFPNYPVKAFLSNYFPTMAKVSYNNYVKNIATSYSDSSQLIINVSNDIADSQSQTTTTEWTTWLESIYKNGNPLVIHYLLAEPNSLSIELPTLVTFDGTTTLEIDTSVAPSGIQAVYNVN